MVSVHPISLWSLVGTMFYLEVGVQKLHFFLPVQFKEGSWVTRPRPKNVYVIMMDCTQQGGAVVTDASYQGLEFASAPAEAVRLSVGSPPAPQPSTPCCLAPGQPNQPPSPPACSFPHPFALLSLHCCFRCSAILILFFSCLCWLRAAAVDALQA